MRKFLYQTIGVCCCLLFLRTAASAQPSGWTVNAADFANTMSISAQVHLDGTEANEPDNWLAAYVGSEIRGVEKAKVINGTAYFFLTIYSNVTNGETVNFKVYHAPTDGILPALEEVNFLKSDNLGGFPDGFNINISLTNDFPISLLTIPPDTTVAGYPFAPVRLEDILVSPDNDPVTWSLNNGTHISAAIGPGDTMTVTANSNSWHGTDSIEVTAQETGTPNGFSASKFLHFTVEEDYDDPIVEGLPVQFVHGGLPSPSGNLNEFLNFAGSCIEYSYSVSVPEGSEPMPVWTLPVGNSGSMNMTVEVHYGGKPFTGMSNKLAAFVGGQLAGTAVPREEQGKILYFIIISNVGKGEIEFQFYDHDHTYLYSQPSGVNFAPSGSDGDVSQPFELDVAPIAIDLAEDGTWTSAIVDPYWVGDFIIDFFATDCEYGDKVGSNEIVFAFNACPEQTITFPPGGELCLLADSVVQEIEWFRNGSPLSSGIFLTAVDTGVYQYQGLTPGGCPDLKSCPVKVTNLNGFGAPVISLPPLPTSWPYPPNCYPRLLTTTDFVICCDEPVANCEAIVTVQLDADGNGQLAAADVDANSIYDCGLLSMSLSQTDFDCSHLGSNHIVTLTVNDVYNRSDDCLANILVVDNVGPAVACPADTTVNCDADYSPVVTGTATANDNCVSATTPVHADVIATGNCTGNFTVTRTWSSLDDFNNQGDCNQIITVQDTIGPSAACKAAPVTLNSQGDGTIAPTDVFDTDNTTDNCSAPVTAVAVSPSYFNCSHTGSNTVTLTVEDACGNQSTCNATVTVGAFVTISSIDHTDETCTNANDGSISITATALGGQLKYSIDGGINFTSSHLFNNLSPGTYSIVVKAFGIPNNCEATASVTVDSGSSSALWYRDLDGDGFTDGTTMTGCTPPSGYVASAQPGDCNDNNANIHPGATELCDGLDNDCDGNMLPGEVDADGDGYFVCDGDCDDNDPNVNPGATEVCNGIDDDCDGEVDEGLSGGLTYTGNVSFNTQAQVDEWSACYSVIDGDLLITGTGIDSLNALQNLVEITGNLNIQSTGLEDLEGLDTLSDVGGTLTIYFNSSLNNLNGLDSLAAVGGSLLMYYNFSLSYCCAIDNLLENGGIVGSTVIFFNGTGSHCNSAPAIMAACPLAPPLIGNHGGIQQVSGEPFKLPNGTKMRMYPNPSSGKLLVIFDRQPLQSKLEILDMYGRVVFAGEVEAGSDRIMVDLASGHLESGIYLVVLTGEEGQIVDKLMIKR